MRDLSGAKALPVRFHLKTIMDSGIGSRVKFVDGKLDAPRSLLPEVHRLYFE
jgi:hypothetical protein